MASTLTVKVADNIFSPLGDTSQANYLAVKAGRSALCRYENHWNIPGAFTASLFDREAVNAACTCLRLPESYTFFEKMVILSVSGALEKARIDVSSPRVLFILSTTKGNVALLDRSISGNFPESRVLLGETALQITTYFRNPNPPVVVSNACISGVCAQITAMRCLQSNRYDYAVVTGADCQSPFILSGFQSFKALSPSPCRPFDRDRNGLNLGEAAATIIYARKEREAVGAGEWVAFRGVVRNDANHISGPSRTGEGCYRALTRVLGDEDMEELAFINVHGTATAYNDEMESVALSRAGLSAIPVNGLKGHYGHTMGAAGILESVLSMYAVDDGTVLATRGYTTSGVSCALAVSGTNRSTGKKAFVKLLSGFGGCNAALLFKKGAILK